MKEIEGAARKSSALSLKFIPHSIRRLSSYALSTSPDLRQAVHTYILCGPWAVITLTDFTLDFHILLDLLWEWLTLLPKRTLLPQTAHFAMILTSLHFIDEAAFYGICPPIDTATCIFYQNRKNNAIRNFNFSKLFHVKERHLLKLPEKLKFRHFFRKEIPEIRRKPNIAAV